MSLKIEQITDVANSTFESRQFNVINDAATTLQSFVAGERLLDKGRLVFGGGDVFKYPIIYRGDTNAAAVGPFEPGELDQRDGTTEGTVGYKILRTGCHHDITQLSANAGKNRIYSFLAAKEYQMWIGLWEMIEEYFWFGPSSSSDDKVPYGMLGYWLDYSGSTGFNGGNHTNWSSGPGGIDCSSAAGTNYQHRTFNYTDITDADGLEKTKDSIELCDFKGIPNKPIKDASPGAPDHEIYTTHDNLKDFRSLLENKNESIGLDLGRYMNSTIIKGVPVTWVPYLQNNHDTSDPIIGVNWNDFRAVTPDGGMWNQRIPYSRAANQPTVFEMWILYELNFVMQNRRSHFLGAKSDPLSD